MVQLLEISFRQVFQRQEAAIICQETLEAFSLLETPKQSEKANRDFLPTLRQEKPHSLLSSPCGDKSGLCAAGAKGRERRP